MTRLKTTDICQISASLPQYNHYLFSLTGRSLLGIACHAWKFDENKIKALINTFSISVVPITAGMGMISGFSRTVCDILEFLGFPAVVTEQTDTAGIAQAFENNADSIMMADDDRFVGIDLDTRHLVDNIQATGNVFAAALDLMAGGICHQSVLVMGCGPVGAAAAQWLLESGAAVTLYDINPKAAQRLQEKLGSRFNSDAVGIIDQLSSSYFKHDHILEATPAADAIPDNLVSDHLRISAPGVPLGLSDTGCEQLKNRLVHDKLELGVAAMAVKLLSEREKET